MLKIIVLGIIAIIVLIVTVIRQESHIKNLEQNSHISDTSGLIKTNDALSMLLDRKMTENLNLTHQNKDLMAFKEAVEHLISTETTEESNRHIKELIKAFEKD